jgi:hypothetical protein
MDGSFIHLDPNGRDLTVGQIQDVEPILDWNRQARAEQQRSDWGRHVARIPNVVLVKWFDAEIARGRRGLRMFSPEFDELVRAKLQDPEWAYLRTDRPALQAGWS